MFSVLKMVKKGLIALGCFAGPLLIPLAVKLVPGANSLTVGDVIIGMVDKIIPNITTLTIGTAAIMFINWMKNK